MQTTASTVGDMPTTGAARPGPVSIVDAAEAPAAEESAGARPIAIRIPAIQVDAEVERAFIVDGLMQPPTGPLVVAWYGQTERVGVAGNAVFAGHVDYAGFGPAVFAQLGALAEGDTVEVIAKTGIQVIFGVVWSRLYDAASAPVEEILAQGDQEEVTLITCGGAFDAAVGLYSDRLIVRARRVA